MREVSPTGLGEVDAAGPVQHDGALAGRKIVEVVDERVDPSIGQPDRISVRSESMMAAMSPQHGRAAGHNHVVQSQQPQSLNRIRISPHWGQR